VVLTYSLAKCSSSYLEKAFVLEVVEDDHPTNRKLQHKKFVNRPSIHLLILGRPLDDQYRA
jgi:hypothetical protein